ncbi:MAG: hypothetical protein ABIJ03_03985 [Patescibacteria group bacterium]
MLIRNQASGALELSIPQTPEQTIREAVDEFAWDTCDLDENNILSHLDSFYQRFEKYGIPKTQELYAVMKQSFSLTRRVYDKLYPNGEMIYHNADHACLTACATAKLFLGWWSIENKENGHKFSMNEFRSIVLVAGLHEFNDWWKRPGNIDSVVFDTRRRETIEIINADLTARGISALDLEKLLCLNSFVLPSTEAVAQAIGLQAPEFLQPNGKSCLSQDSETLQAYDAILAGADYIAQLFNKKYLDIVELSQERGAPLGPAVLGDEMNSFWKEAGEKWLLENEKLSKGTGLSISNKFLNMAIPIIEAVKPYYIAFFGNRASNSLRRQIAYLKIIAQATNGHPVVSS